MLYSLLPAKYLFAAAAVVTPGLCALLLKLLGGKLPRDQGRDFAVDGKKSAGKIRGAGLLFVCSFIICALLFAPLSIEAGIYYAVIFLAMLSGYLDDRSEKPWNEYKKGIIDLVIAAGTSAAFVYFNKPLLNISLFGFGIHIHPVVYFILGIILIWMLINAVNCCDGIDGYSSTLTGISYISLAIAAVMKTGDWKPAGLVAIMLLTLLPYLWVNSEPSTMMMGDAGSRALGIFLAILVMKSGNALLVIPLCFVICMDGLIGIAKVSIIRFLHIKVLTNIRTPLHDHSRKNKGRSNTQVIYRYSIVQILISALTLILMK